VIGVPFNDLRCLGSITEVVAELVENGDTVIAEIAAKHATTESLATWIRSLPQRDDDGRPGDGPKVGACAPPQRLRLPAPDPNCVERAALYLVLGELIAPEVGRRLATVDTDAGLHTLPVERDAPVVLDPRVTRNGARAGVDRLAGVALPTNLPASAAWTCAVAAEPAATLPGGARRVRNASQALLAAGRGVPMPGHLMEDVALALALAGREARRWGPAGERVVARVARAVLDLQRATQGCGRGADPAGDDAVEGGEADLRNGLRLGRVPRALGATLRALGVVGLDAGSTLARAKLAALGLPARFLGVLERELNREGVTLGALGRPTPPAYSFAALTKDAILARHLEQGGGA